MNNRTSIDKDHLATLLARSNQLEEMVQTLQKLADDDQAIVNFSHQSLDLDVTINRQNNTIKDWNK